MEGVKGKECGDKTASPQSPGHPFQEEKQ